METIAVQVARGAEWLDAAHPGWEDKVNTNALNMVTNCVLMQVGGYDLYLEQLSGRGCTWLLEHAFLCAGRAEWIATIEARRAEKRAAVEVHTEAEVNA